MAEVRSAPSGSEPPTDPVLPRPNWGRVGVGGGGEWPSEHMCEATVRSPLSPHWLLARDTGSLWMDLSVEKPSGFPQSLNETKTGQARWKPPSSPDLIPAGRPITCHFPRARSESLGPAYTQGREAVITPGAGDDPWDHLKGCLPQGISWL